MVEMNDLIKIKNLFLVSNTENRNLIDISNLQFDNNSISVIMGPNGAGKTLLLNLIQGLILTYTGDIEINYNSKNEDEIRGIVAKKLNIKVSDVENMENRFINEDKSLNAKVSDDYNQEFGNFIVDDNSLDEIEIVNRLDLARKRTWFKKAMRELGIRESQIIALRHLSDDPLTLEKLGESFKISKERVRQIENRAIKKLKSLVRKLSSKESRMLKIK